MADFKPAKATARSRVLALPKRAHRALALTAIAIFCLLALHMLPTGPRRYFVPSTFDWTHAKQFNPPGSIKALPTGQPSRPLPLVQAPISAFKNPHSPDPRRERVKMVFKRSWDAYKQYAWMEDELEPVMGRGRETFGGWAATLVDSLDTLWIMGFNKEFSEAAEAMVSLDFARTRAGAVNLFETTIRHLGGLISAYDLSGDEDLLSKAVELGDMLYMGFDTPNRLPGFWLNFGKAIQGTQQAGTNDPSAVPASLCLEFTRLSQITGNSKYYSATDRVTRFLEKVQYQSTLPGMWPTTLDFRNERAAMNTYTLGALADSLYEYLPKMHALLGGVDETYEKMYRGSMDVAIKHLLFRPMLPNKEDILFSGDAKVFPHSDEPVELTADSQHLTCFAGGMFGLGGKLFDIDDHLSIGERLARGCGWAYAQFPTGVMPEIFGFAPCETKDGCEWDEEGLGKNHDSTVPKGWKHARDPRYLLRPEAIESVFLMYRMTGREEYRDMAWDMFQGILKSTETEIAYSAVASVKTKGETEKLDSMESFWTAETLKYFYLIFSPPDEISLDEYVFNTEAHPFKRPV